MNRSPLSIILVTGFLLGSLLVVWSFLDVLLFGILTAYFLIYFEKKIYERIENRIASNILIVFGITAVLGALLYGISSSVTTIIQNIDQFFTNIAGSTSYIITLFNLPPSLSTVIESLINDVSAIIRSGILNQIRNVPKTIIEATIYITAVYYFYRDGLQIRQTVYQIIEEFSEPYHTVATVFARSISDLLRGIFLNRALASFTVTALAAIGFFVLGLEFWWGWAILSGVFSFLPYFQSFLLYLPLGGLYMTLGRFWLGTAIIIYGILVLKTLPTLFLKPHLSTHRANEPPILLFLGFIGGSLVFGFKGILLGPIILVLTKEFFKEIFGLTPEPS